MGKFACVRAVATYLPEKIESNDGMDPHFVKKLGIKSRHVASKEEAAGDLAYFAAENLFNNHGVSRKDIDFVLLCVQHPDYQMPNTACHLQSRLGLDESCGALDYSLGCSGYVYGLSLAKGLIETGMATNLLLLTSSVYLKYINQKDHTIRHLFGDGATATYISAEEGEAPFLDAFAFGTDGSRFDRLFIPAGGSRHMPRDTEEIFTEDERGNIRSNYEVYMDGTAITYFTLRVAPQIVERVLAKKGITRKDLNYCVFHQANKFMMEYVQKKCALTDVPFWNDIETIGNTVSGTIPFALESLFKKENPANLKQVMLAGFGVGLSWAGCMADFSHISNA